MTTEMTSEAGPSNAPRKKVKSILKKTNYKGPLPSIPLETHIETNEDDDGLTKRERLQLLIKKKKECDAKAKKIVEDLIEFNVERKYLLENAAFISTTHWEDVVEERSITKICGWALCDNPLGNVKKQQYSIRNNRVFDITERKKFCSPNCYAVASHFKNQLLTSPLWMRDEEPIPEFQILQDKSKQLHGMDVSFSNINLNDEENEQEKEQDEARHSDDD